MIIRRLTIAVVLIAGWYFAAACHLLPPGIGFQDSSENNAIKADHWATRTSLPEVAIVGSSQAGVLSEEYFSIPVVNLGMSGKGCLAGLHVLDQCKHLPPVVLVEMSFFSVHQDSDADLLAETNQRRDCLLAPLPYELRPLNILFAAIAKNNTVPRLDDATVGRLQRLTGYAEEVRLSAEKRKLISKHAEEAAVLIANLQRRGARVILFEMPIDRRAQKGGRELAAWQLIREKFPAGKYSWLRVPDQDWKTQDLVHMYPESAKQFAGALEHQLVMSVAMNDRRTAL